MVSWKHYLKALRLPLILVAIFLVQNFFFNLWVGLYPSPVLFSLLVASVTLGVIVYGPGALMNGVWRYVYLFGASVAVSALFISQYVYFAYFGGFLQASALTYAGQAGAEWDTIATLISPQLLLFIVNILFVIGAFLVRHRTGFVELSVRKKERALIAIVLITLIVLGYGFRIASSDNALRILQHPVVALHEINSFTFSPNATVQEIGVGNYYLDDIVGFFLRNVPVSPQDIAFAAGILEQKKPTVAKEQYAGLAKGDNLIYVQVESLEAADIGQSVAGQEITPNLNALARQGLYFDNYYTQIGPGNTADAEFSTLNSLYPLSNEVAFIAYPHNTYDALPGTLVKNGYHTYALHGDVSDFWNRANIYPSLGYQDEISKDDFTAIETGFPTLDDDDFLSQSAVKMQSFTAPFMATVITLSSHTPFDIPPDYQKLVFPANSTLTDRQKSYLESIHYTDASLGAFIAQLKKEGIYQKSVIAIFGDHGSFTDISSALGPAAAATLVSLSNSRVPLILLSPKLNALARGTVSTPGSHIDLFPTVANLLGITVPQSALGQDLLNTKTPLVTHRDPYSGAILAILTPTKAYENNGDGMFANGSCFTMPAETALPLSDCQALYDQQSANTRASDLVITGNLLAQFAFAPMH